jgi:anti-sigma regulatory factor (Ser/Thr protein kinase)
VSTSGEVLLPYAPASVPAARWRLAADLKAAGVAGPVVADAALVVSELVTNAIRHARPLAGRAVGVAWSLRDGQVEVSVSDGGAITRPQPTRPGMSAPGGRGLAIVEHVAKTWGVYSSDQGTTVWAVLPVGSVMAGCGASWAGTPPRREA